MPQKRLSNLERLYSNNRGRHPYREEFKTWPMPMKAPDTLSAGAKVIWNVLGRQLVDEGILTNLDAMHFGIYCESLDELNELQAALKEKGVVLANGKINPLLRAVERKSKAVAKQAEKFGTTPLDRQRMRIRPIPLKEKQSKLAIMLAGGDLPSDENENPQKSKE